MHPRRALILMGMLYGLSTGLNALTQPNAPTAPCSAPFQVTQEHFKRLPPPAQYAYVWTDDVPSKLFGGYSEFLIAVFVGSAYPPFQAESGRLERDALDRIGKSSYGVKRTDFRANETAVKARKAVVTFASAGQSFQLKVVSVQARPIGTDTVTFQLCR